MYLDARAELVSKLSLNWRYEVLYYAVAILALLMVPNALVIFTQIFPHETFKFETSYTFGLEKVDSIVKH